jgi:hypothetical protein
MCTVVAVLEWCTQRKTGGARVTASGRSTEESERERERERESVGTIGSDGLGRMKAPNCGRRVAISPEWHVAGLPFRNVVNSDNSHPSTIVELLDLHLYSDSLVLVLPIQLHATCTSLISPAALCLFFLSPG